MKNTLKLIWQNRKTILEGITNSVIRDETIEEIAALRYSMCNECTSKGTDCAVKGTGPCCNECGCSLSLKTRSLASDCPLGKWKSIVTVEEEDKLENL
tara:strand:+ start:778 stop:1071 length:294 start_codon:yes stop_codon:yes gene_type:complete